MKAYVVKHFLGVFALDERGKLLDCILFKDGPKTVVKKMSETCSEEKELTEKLKGYTIETGELGEKLFRRNFRQIVKRLKLSDNKVNESAVSFGLEFTRQATKQNVKMDRIIIQAVNAIDEMDKSLNIFMARLREWYGLHFPEMEAVVDSHEKFVKIVSKSGLRENIQEKDFVALAKESMGIDLSEIDEKIIKEYAEKIKELYKLRADIEKYIEGVMVEIAPNSSVVGGPVLTARLIALAGGLDRLSKKPSSTIQLLGAEKALFRFLRGRGRSPKHGILYQHPYVQKAPMAKKGKVARIVAAKLNMAIKMDRYGKEDRSEKLKKDLEKRFKEVMVK